MPIFHACYSHFQSCPRSRGFTLAELLIVLAILAIITALAVPAFSNASARARVKDATESIYGLISQARNESAVRDTNLSIAVNPDHWCLGIAPFPGCDCTLNAGATACVLDVAGTSILQTVTGDEFPDVAITETFPGVGTTFNRLRRTASPGGTIALSSRGQSLEIKIGLTGRTRVCAPEGSAFPGYPAC
ncbi:MAG: Tfp pilus assembly protein FimT/FimU [Porticoccaceae bacterium]